MEKDNLYSKKVIDMLIERIDKIRVCNSEFL